MTMVIIFVLLNGGETERVSYSEVYDLFKEEKVKSFEYDGSSDVITMIVRDDKGDGTHKVEFEVYSFSLFYEDFNQLIKEQYESGIITDYEITQPQTNWWLAIIPYVITFGLIVLFWYIMMNRSGGGANGIGKFGKARTRLGSEEKNKKTFKDVAGADEEKEELREIVDSVTPRRSPAWAQGFPRASCS